MTTEAVLQFRQAVNSSPAMQQEACALSSLAPAELVEMGARHGFQFTEDELASVAGSVGDELTDFELELISGGVDVLGGSYVRRNAATNAPVQPYTSKDPSNSLC
jgi:predicted ribosomally synthesized peptide with nif11-like leader